MGAHRTARIDVKRTFPAAAADASVGQTVPLQDRLRKTGVRAKAAIPLRARNTLIKIRVSAIGIK